MIKLKQENLNENISKNKYDKFWSIVTRTISGLTALIGIIVSPISTVIAGTAAAIKYKNDIKNNNVDSKGEILDNSLMYGFIPLDIIFSFSNKILDSKPIDSIDSAIFAVAAILLAIGIKESVEHYKDSKNENKDIVEEKNTIIKPKI